jgi:hypothetical protein
MPLADDRNGAIAAFTDWQKSTLHSRWVKCLESLIRDL